MPTHTLHFTLPHLPSPCPHSSATCPHRPHLHACAPVGYNPILLPLHCPLVALWVPTATCMPFTLPVPAIPSVTCPAHTLVVLLDRLHTHHTFTFVVHTHLPIYTHLLACLILPLHPTPFPFPAVGVHTPTCAYPLIDYYRLGGCSLYSLLF